MDFFTWQQLTILEANFPLASVRFIAVRRTNEA